MITLLKLLSVLLLIFLNGFFVAAEYALVSVRKTRIDELVRKGNRTAKIVQFAIQHINNYISAIQLGITIVSLALGWIGEPALASLFIQLFMFLPHALAQLSAHTLAILVAFSVITYFHVVLGELAPKTMALQNAETFALLLIRPLDLFTKLFLPIIWLLNKSSQLILRLLHVNPANSEKSVHSEEEIKSLLTQSGQSGVIPKDEVALVYNVFRLGDLTVKQIMLPRVDIVAFDMDTTLQNTIKRIKRSRYSRFPVYKNTIDTIIGYIHIKDILKLDVGVNGDKTLAELDVIRDIIMVADSQKADDVLAEMQKEHVHVAVVADEYGGTEGIVTLEDIIERLVGEIQDEFEKPLEKGFQKQDDGSFLISGSMPIDQVTKKFPIPIKGQGLKTIGGLLFSLLGREPKVGDSIQLGSATFTIIMMDRNRVGQIRVTKHRGK